MKRRKGKRDAASRARAAAVRAEKSIADAGWVVLRYRGLPYITTAKVEETAKRFVAVQRIPEREDDSVTLRYESDYTIEGLAAAVARRAEES